jgi:hypothetical protein
LTAGEAGFAYVTGWTGGPIQEPFGPTEIAVSADGETWTRTALPSDVPGNGCGSRPAPAGSFCSTSSSMLGSSRATARTDNTRPRPAHNGTYALVGWLGSCKAGRKRENKRKHGTEQRVCSGRDYNPLPTGNRWRSGTRPPRWPSR